MEEPSFIVPPELSKGAESVVKLLQETARKQGLDDQVHLLHPRSLGFGPEELRTIVLVLGGSVASWLTSKWIDTYLWPLIQERIDEPSKEFIDWLRKNLPGG